MYSTLRSFSVRNLLLLWKKISFPFILFNAFKAIGSPEKVSSKTQPRYVTYECCFSFMFLYLLFRFPALLILRLLVRRIDLVLSSRKCMFDLLSTIQLQMFSKSVFSCLVYLFNFFRISMLVHETWVIDI